MGVVNNILGNKGKQSIEDWYGKIVYVGNYITDENGNVGKVTQITNDTAIVNFGKNIGSDAVYSGSRIKKGKSWR